MIELSAWLAPFLATCEGIGFARCSAGRKHVRSPGERQGRCDTQQRGGSDSG